MQLRIRETSLNRDQVDLISDALGIEAFSYNSEVTDELWNVLQMIYYRTSTLCTDDIARALELKPSHVELIQYLLCNNRHGEYGTSPRCMWLTEKGKKLVEKIGALEHADNDSWG